MKNEDNKKDEEIKQLRKRIKELEISESDCKQAMRALLDIKTLLSRSQEIAHIGSWELNLTNNQLIWSDEVYRIFGLEPHEFEATYKAFIETVHPEDRAKVDAAYYGSLREGMDSYEIEHRVIRKRTGEVRHVHEKCMNVRDATGTIVHSIGMVQDITERKQAEEELLNNKQFLNDVFDGIQDGISVLGKDLSIISINKWMENMYKAEMPLIGKKCYAVYQKRNSVCPWCPSIKTIETGEVHTEIVPYPSAEKPAGWIELSSYPMKDKDGNIVKVIEHVKNITERKQAEEELHKLKEELEMKVAEQTGELSKKVKELERFRDATIDREFRMKELRDEIEKLKGRGVG